MTKNNTYLPKENYKQVEEVREINNEIPTFEKFMESYEGPVNYDDLNSGDISEVKGYGPCNNSSRTCSSSLRFRFGYKATNYIFGSAINYSHIYECAEELRNDVHNLHTKSGKWSTEYFGPFLDRRITDFQASEGQRYAKFALKKHDEGYSVNLKSWCICH